MHNDRLGAPRQLRLMKRLCLPPALAGALRLRDVPVVVTGTGGWLGQAALEMLEGALGEDFARRVRVYAAAARDVRLRCGLVVQARAFAELEREAGPPGLVLHFAFLTRGFAQAPDFEAVNRRITAAVRGYIERNGAAGVFIPSSGAAYRAEHDIYGALKLEDEAVFAALAKRLGFPAVIPRIFNLAGPFINNVNHYALACMIADVAGGRPVRLRAAHPVWRSYAHVGDVLSIGLAGLLRGVTLEGFDTAGEVEVEIGDLAARVARVMGAGGAEIIRPAWREGAADYYTGDMAGYRRAAALAGVSLRGLDEQIADTAGYLASLG
ncbi:hypothetical protein GCM10010909_19960 [Acidocella aquatica]|uniref:NAD-dependent epimerase/dehydratase domain-containing protein n=1 Tax=Acidocella aquatica TaxID=1922313 RepID=A0ABQ6A497_9PROT|nr:NAD(P)-dependent oxidoreductase [Acidocella aquatica]GLR67315.1 hypothetical protein GCM10010909_19960 [Acidocella aquatica]